MLGKGFGVQFFFSFGKLLGYLGAFVGVANKFLFYIPFLTCFLYFGLNLAYSLVLSSPLFLLSVAFFFFFFFAWHGLWASLFSLPFFFLSSSTFVRFGTELFFLALFIEGMFSIRRPGRISYY